MPDIEKLAQEIAEDFFGPPPDGIVYNDGPRNTLRETLADHITRHLAAWAKERGEDTARLDWLILEAMYEGPGPDRDRIIDDKNGVALVIGGGIGWPDGVRAAIDALRDLGEGGSDE